MSERRGECPLRARTGHQADPYGQLCLAHNISRGHDNGGQLGRSVFNTVRVCPRAQRQLILGRGIRSRVRSKGASPPILLNLNIDRSTLKKIITPHSVILSWLWLGKHKQKKIFLWNNRVRHFFTAPFYCRLINRLLTGESWTVIIEALMALPH